MKRILTLMLAVLLAISLFSGISLPVHAAEDDLPDHGSGTLGDITWTLEGGVLTLSGQGPLTTVSGDTANPWMGRYHTVKLVVEDGVTAIGDSAFFSLSDLEEAVIADSVTEIGSQAFDSCGKLRTVKLPAELVHLGEKAFAGTSSLKTITLPDALKTIDYLCFFQSGLTEITFPAGLETLGQGAFQNTPLRSVVFTGGPNEISLAAFLDCGSLSEVTLANQKKLCAQSFYRTALQSITLPVSVESMDANVFNTMLRKLVVMNPNMVFPESLGSYYRYLEIHGFDESTAQQFAQKHDIPFQVLHDCANGHHTWVEDTVLQPPTCQEKGTMRYQCRYCEATKTEEMDLIDHDDVLVEILTEPTYFQTGKGRYRCSMCGREREETLPLLEPGFLYQQILYNRDSWEGLYAIAGYELGYDYEKETWTLGNNMSLLTIAGETPFSTQRMHNQLNGMDYVQTTNGQYAYYLHRLENGNYTIRSFWNKRYLSCINHYMGYVETPTADSEWKVYVDESGEFVIESVSAPGWRLLYNYLDKKMQLLYTFTYGGEAYEAKDIFGIELLDQGDSCIFKFSDVNIFSWYHEGVHFAVENQLFQGVDYSHFAPNQAMNRAMFVTVLWRMMDKPEPKQASTGFTDVKENSWYSKAVAWANEEGLVKGLSETSFGPTKNITREQMAVLMARFVQWLGGTTEETADLSLFPDGGQTASYAKDAMAWANAVGLITGSKSGSETLLLPKGNATRAQVATILMRFVLLMAGRD